MLYKENRMVAMKTILEERPVNIVPRTGNKTIITATIAKESKFRYWRPF